MVVQKKEKKYLLEASKNKVDSIDKKKHQKRKSNLKDYTETGFRGTAIDF